MGHSFGRPIQRARYPRIPGNDDDRIDTHTNTIRTTHGSIPTTCSQRTGSGGLQLLLRYPDEPVGNRTGLEPGIDLRGDGGYVYGEG